MHVEGYVCFIVDGISASPGLIRQNQASLADEENIRPVPTYTCTMNNLAFKVAAGQKNLRLACDLCHQGKVKCSGGTPCEGCRKLGVRCKYSTSNRTGRPKGVKNKKTLDRIKQLRADDASEHEHEETRVAGNVCRAIPNTSLRENWR